LLIFKTRSNLTSNNNSTAHQFLTSDIATYNLPNYVLNILCHRYQCKTPNDVLVVGKQKLKTSKEIGKTAIKQIETLFKKHKCNHLF
jgi:hypothetical protein